RRHTSFSRDWSSDVCSSDLVCVPERSGAGADERMELRVHFAFSGHLFGARKKEQDTQFHPLICAGSTAFWDAYLRGNAAAKEWQIGRAACREREQVHARACV